MKVICVFNYDKDKEEDELSNFGESDIIEDSSISSDDEG